MTDAPRWPIRIAMLVIVALGAFAALTPIGNGFLLANLTVYDELFAQAWDEFGFGASLGVPMVNCIGDTVQERVPYAHQAPVGWWFPYFGRQIFGKTAFGYKAFASLFTVLGALLIIHHVARRSGPFQALIFASIYALLPVVLLYAGLPGIESISLFFGALFHIAYERYREGPSRRGLLWLLACLFLGTQTAWSFCFVVAGSFLSEFLRPAPERRLRTSFLFGLFGLGCVGVVILHLVLGTGSFQAVLGDVFHSASIVLSGDMTRDESFLGRKISFFPSQGTFLLENLGPMIGPLVLGMPILLLCRRIRLHPLARTALVFTVHGALTVIIFQGRSNTHAYYWFLMATPAALWLVLLLDATSLFVSDRKTTLAKAALLLLIASGLALGIKDSMPRLLAATRTGLKDFGEAVDSQVPEGDWVCALDTTAIEGMLHSKRRWTPPILSPWMLQQILDARTKKRIPMGRLWIWMDAENQAILKDLHAHLESLAAKGEALRLSLPPRLVFAL